MGPTPIIAAEIAFWLLLAAGLVARYPLARPRLGAALLISTPLVDLGLLALTAADLSDGGTATRVHALAAVYLGVSVGFGGRIVGWADERFAHRFAGGAAPAPRPRAGRAHARAERSGWYHHLLAWALGSGLLALAIVIIGDAERTEALAQTIGVWSMILAVDFAWSFSYTLWPRAAS